MGTPEFALGTLDLLVRSKQNVVAVITAPDKPAGRGRQLHESAVKQFAVKNSIPVLQPEKLKDEKFLNDLRELKADLQVVVAFRMLPEAVWNMPPMGTINLHASLLPKYRGAAPINRAIMNGETETGVTTFKLKHEIDTGNILFREKVSISETMTAGMLHDKLMKTGAHLMLRTVREIQRSFEKGVELNFLPQNDEEASHAPKIFKNDCRIDWSMPVKNIYNFVRGLSPYPGAFTEIKNGEALQVLKIFSSRYELTDQKHTNGSLITDNKTFFKISATGGLLEVTELQLEGKKRMRIEEFLKGYKAGAGSMIV